MWPEVQVAKSEKRRELVLSGKEISERIADGALDDGIFTLDALNLLTISNAALSSISSKLGNLVNLVNLDLSVNKLTVLPSGIGSLQSLKYLNLSFNELESVPDEVCVLTKLEHLNVTQNKLTDFPAIGTLQFLHYFYVEGNRLEALPEGICSLKNLLELKAAHNQIETIPAEMCEMLLLRLLDMSDNCITEVPSELGEAPKIKDLNLKNNKVKDRRLKKMLEQSATKSILEHLKGILAKERAKGGAKKEKAKPKGKKKGPAAPPQEEAKPSDVITVLRSPADQDLTVELEPAVTEVRPYVVCCVIRGVDFTRSLNMFKRFINVQTKLHDTLCDKRQQATIATHDLKLVRWPLTYTAAQPQDITLRPLGRGEEVSAGDLMTQLTTEAHDLRKEKKRSTVSGIHKYLELLSGHQTYPCIKDSQGQVISFPPITNSELTKITRETRDVLVEVTSSAKLDVCKKVMTALVLDTLALGLGNPPPQGDASEQLEEMTLEAGGGDGDDSDLEVEFAGGTTRHHLSIEQVRVVCDGSLRSVYPDRTDLSELPPDIKLVRQS